MLMRAPEGFLDDVGRLFGPDKRCRVSIPLGEIPLDVADKRAQGVEGAAAHGLAGEDAEPRLDHIEPRGPRGREVEVDPGMRGQPRLHRGRRVRGGVVAVSYTHLT